MATTTTVLDALRDYDELRRNGTVIRHGNLDITLGLAAGGKDRDRDVAFCHLVGILPFTKGDYVPDRGNFERAANIALAVAHLNSGDGSIVPQVSKLNERCNIRFTTEFGDTEYNGGVAMNVVVDAIRRPTNSPSERLPCAFIGASRSSVSMPSSIVSGISGYPQISPGSTSAALDDKAQYPLFGRTVPSDQGNTLPIIIYLYQALQVKHLAVINANDAYGNAYVDGMRAAAAEHAPDMVISQIPLDSNDDHNIKAAVTAVKKTGFRFVFAVVFKRPTHDALLTEAYHQGVAGTGVHNWLFGDSFVGILTDRTVEKNSPLHLAYRGVGMLEVSGGIPGIPSFDHYADKIAAVNQNPADMEYLASLFPKHDDQPAYTGSEAGNPPFSEEPNFLRPLTYGFAPFAYEAAIALGLSACDAYSDTEEFTGKNHFDALKQTTFTGVGGKVIFDPETGTRKPDSALHKVSNWIEEQDDGEEIVDLETGKSVIRFRPVVTDLFQDGSWNRMEDYVFNDGTTNLPQDLPTPGGSENAAKHLGLAIGLPLIFVLIGGVLIYLFYENKRKQNDMVWQVEKEELSFSNPPKVVGRGTYGLVLLAEYRGTQVAVKRVIPPKSEKSRDERLDPSESCATERDRESEDLGSCNGGGSGSNINNINNINNNDNNNDNKDNIKKGADVRGSVTSTDSATATATTTNTNSIGMTSVGIRSWAPGIKSGSWGTSSLTHILGLTSKHGLRKGRKAVFRQSDAAAWRKMRQDFVEEMRYLSKLRHPCVTTIMGAVLGKDPMLVMEYMEHGSLYDILHNETMVIDSELVLPILRDISQGVRFLHSATPQVIHGDLKAQNILVDAKFRAKVADFGLSQKQNFGTGTPFWMAPELLRRESSNNAATDAYSFGIILYEVYSRRDPYEDENARDVLRLVCDKSVRKRPSPTPKNMPAKVKSLMSDCLEEDPTMRPTFEELDTRVKRIDAEAADGANNHQSKTPTVSLFDIFPRHVAVALRDGNTVEPEHRECVTIFFSDIVGFTTISSQLAPGKIADMLDRLYSKFDELSHAHDVFKVETIGDAYMAVSNLVKDQKSDHAKRIAEFAVDAIAAARSTKIDLEDDSKGCVNIRVGFHSGSVVADVVGTRNPRYCLFGDAVNTASRMESNSRPDRIHCSRISAQYLRKQCPEMKLKSRGKVHIKGKGDMITYWVNYNGEGGVNNEKTTRFALTSSAKKQPDAAAAAGFLPSLAEDTCEGGGFASTTLNESFSMLTSDEEEEPGPQQQQQQQQDAGDVEAAPGSPALVRKLSLSSSRASSSSRAAANDKKMASGGEGEGEEEVVVFSSDDQHDGAPPAPPKASSTNAVSQALARIGESVVQESLPGATREAALTTLLRASEELSNILGAALGGGSTATKSRHAGSEHDASSIGSSTKMGYSPHLVKSTDKRSGKSKFFVQL